MVIGLKYRNYTNYDGTLADGTCCDHPSLTAPNCPADQCDTSFMPCATYVGGPRCGAYFQSATPTMVDYNSFVLQNKIGNGGGISSSATIALRTPFSPDDISFNILAEEVSSSSRELIASFHFNVDWMDTFYSDIHWRSFLLKDTRAELGLDVIRQCYRSYFGPTCSVKCDPTPQYTCLNDGSKNCTKGWQGPDCTDLVPYCTVGLCQNGGTCTNIHLGYFCTCQPFYWGQYCDNKNTSSTALSADMLTTNSSSTTNGSSDTTKTSSNNNDLTTIVATSVSFGLLLFGILLAASVYVYMMMKKRQSRGKVQPSSPPTDSRADVQTDNRKTNP